MTMAWSEHRFTSWSFVEVFHAGRGHEAGGRGQSCDHPTLAPLLGKGKIQ
jgi:hypothetical protein